MKPIEYFTRKLRNLFLRTDDRGLHLLAKILINQHHNIGPNIDIHKAEFKVYSQFGDDGIIQYLIQRVKLHPSESRFVEIGVEDYQEANTRFLLMNNNWSGLIIDGDARNINIIKKEQYYWQYDLTAIPLFVTQLNILKTLKDHHYGHNLGILSIDIDGNDYWILKQLIVLRPIIIIIEYNSLFGLNQPVTIPYQHNFFRTNAHYSNLYWGSSLKSIYQLAKHNGYAFVGTNSTGNNAYFVRRDRLGKIPPLTLRKGFVYSKYRESRDQSGKLTFLSRPQRLDLIKNLPVHNTVTNKKMKIKQLHQL